MEKSRPQSLEHIEQQRLALEKLLSITRDIARLRSGFTSIARLEQLDYHPTDEVRLYLKLLDAEVINAADPTLIELLRNMDHRVTRSLDNLLGKTVFDSADADDLLLDYPDDLAREITEFRENTHASIGLRALLKQRGLDTPPFKLAVPVSTIQDKIHALREKEAVYKQQVNGQMDDLLRTISDVLRDSSLPEDLEQYIRQVHSDLQHQKEHLESGRELSDIPITVESVILKSDLSEQPRVEEVIAEALPTEQAADVQEQDRARKANGLLKRIFLWVNSSWNVSWKDTKYR